MSEINEDIECLKYYFKHGFSTGGSTVRLARMARIGYIVMIVIIIFVLIFVGK